ncbi:9824_t:CDS:2, partial [Paraglomus occultum]
KVMADGVGYLNDVSNYQIVCMEGAKPGARNEKNRLQNEDKYTQAFEYMVQLLVKLNSPLQCLIFV